VIYISPVGVSVLVGKDGAVYAGTTLNPYLMSPQAESEQLWKLDRDGNLLWIWEGNYGGILSCFGADATGRAFIRSEVESNQSLPGIRGVTPPSDAAFVVLDEAGEELHNQDYVTGVRDLESGGFVYYEEGPVHSVVTQTGDLLSGSESDAAQFDTWRNALWMQAREDIDDFWPVDALSAGHCQACITTSHALYAFDGMGNLTETLLLTGENAWARSWAADEVGNIYVLVEQPARTTTSLRRYQGASGWSPSSP